MGMLIWTHIVQNLKVNKVYNHFNNLYNHKNQIKTQYLRNLTYTIIRTKTKNKRRDNYKYRYSKTIIR